MNRLIDYLYNLEIADSKVETQLTGHLDQAYVALTKNQSKVANQHLNRVASLAKTHNLRKNQNGGGRDNLYGKLPPIKEHKLFNQYDSPETPLDLGTEIKDPSSGSKSSGVIYENLPETISKRTIYDKVELEPALRDFYHSKFNRDMALDHLRKNPEIRFILRDVTARAKASQAPEIAVMAKQGFYPYKVLTTLNAPADPDKEHHSMIFINEAGEVTTDLNGQDRGLNLTAYLKRHEYLPENWN